MPTLHPNTRRSLRMSRALIAAGLAIGVVGLTGLPALGASTDGVTGVGPVNATGGGAIPPIKHVWTIILENSDEAATLAQDSTGTGELTNVLRNQGAFIPDYFATGHSSLDNYIALASAQGPTEQTQGDCSDDNDPIGFPLATASDTRPDAGDSYRTSVKLNVDGQAIGDPAAVSAGKAGCTFPANVPTLGMQLSAAGDSWKTYAQGEDDFPQNNRTTCQSAQYAPDKNSTATNATFAANYARKHDPELYFYGVTGLGGTSPANPACDTEEVGLHQLSTDLAAPAASNPTYSLIVPDLCNDAHDSAFNGVPSVGANGVATAGCKANSVGPDDKTPAASEGIAQADNFLAYWVPQILGSPAYKDNGLLMITFDEGTEALACCGEQPSINLPSAASNGSSSAPDTEATRGGGMVGMVAISPFITPGTTSLVSYNHYSYVRTIEDMFHLTPANTKSAAFPNGIAGSDGQGHIGFAGSQGGSTASAPASMGVDVFDNPAGVTVTPALPDSRIAVLLPIAALLLGAGFMTRRMRRTA